MFYLSGRGFDLYTWNLIRDTMLFRFETAFVSNSRLLFSQLAKCQAWIERPAASCKSGAFWSFLDLCHLIALKMICWWHPAIGREKVPSPYNHLLGLLSFSLKSQHINLLNGDGTFRHHGLPVFYTSCALKCALVCCRYKSVCWRTRRYSWAALSLKTEKIGDWSLKTEWVTLFPGIWQSKRKKNRETADVTWFVRKWEFSGSENQEPKSLLKILVCT